jgi:hypothetical protein
MLKVELRKTPSGGKFGLVVVCVKSDHGKWWSVLRNFCVMFGSWLVVLCVKNVCCLGGLEDEVFCVREDLCNGGSFVRILKGQSVVVWVFLESGND